LDLVDYAGTLRRGGPQDYDPYAAVARAVSPPRITRPFSDQSSMPPPPSLYTGSSAPSSSQTHNLSTSSRRPILHQTRHHNHVHSPGNSHYPPSSFPEPAAYPYSHEQDREERFEFGGIEDDFDVQKFPSWSRNWFKSQGRLPELDLAEPYADPYYDRDLLPWSSQRSDQPVSPDTKEERLKMLQKAFGHEQRPLVNGRLDSDNTIGGVDERGRLITGGHKKRVATRVFQALMVLIAGGVSIYAALFIKVTTPTIAPPPAKRFGTYALYVLSVLTLLAITYVFALQPCCCPGKREGKSDSFTGSSGMMVFPVQGPPNGKAHKKHKKKHKGMMPPQGDIQVNLIVDPQMLKQQMNGGREPEDEERIEEEDDEDWTRTVRPKRRSVFDGFRMEAAWKIARAKLKRHIAFDVVLMILWGVEFVLILIGPRCPSGGFNGWCNAFNLATAASCFLVLLFGLSLYFGVRDLHASKVSPRQRT